MTEITNLLRNPDFEESDGTSFFAWYGFGWCELKNGGKFKGKRSCETVNRRHVYSGMAQDVLELVKLGKRYEFSSHVKLSDSVNDEEIEVVKVVLQYKLSTQAEMCYLKIAEKKVGLVDWELLSGKLCMPPSSPGVLLDSAVLHFECPCVEIDFMAAHVELKEVPGVDDNTMGNLIKNPCFDVMDKDVPVDWKSFGNVKFGRGSLTYEGGATCQTFQRQALWAGIAQDVLYEVKLGHRYRFSAMVRICPDVGDEGSYRVCCSLKLKLSTDKDDRFKLFAVAEPVTTTGWVNLAGQLNMPLGENNSVLQSALLYFDGPPHDVNYIVADVSLHDVTPPGVKRRLSSEVMNSMNKETVKESKVPQPSYPSVYLSYNLASQSTVEELKKRLTQAGVHVLDVHCCNTGDDLISAVNNGMNKAQVIVACITQEHCGNEVNQGEITLAHLHQKTICPVLCEPMEWPPKCSAMRIYQKLKLNDFSRSDEVTDEMVQQLLSIIKK